ncbi:porin family protein [Vibrio sp. 14N.309.X.WAT.E.F5]|uniref:porin family protein n=1 Tax=Vibrio sp. 14N.309.X.WAT.E.F5 TaxID=2998321 RepID=UPI0025AF65BD|nr:porin family protein [Vibrio sp. 14N.309.X.WAT.E.F5]MDN2665674.1 porin family protein [Vibrio sp. 14N.309.X.WAT.E.F5]
MNNKFILSIAVMFACFSNLAVSGERGYYFGGGVGSADIDDGGMYDHRSTPTSMKADDNTYHLIAGYKFNRIVSLELQYTNYGDVKTKSDGHTVMTWSPKAYSLSGNIGYTFNNGIRPYGIIGLSYIELDHEYAESARLVAKILDKELPKVNDSGEALRIGLGVEYTPRVVEGISFRVGYESDIFDFKHFDEQTYSMTLGSFFVAGTYHF